MPISPPCFLGSVHMYKSICCNFAMVFHFVICSHPAVEEPVSLPPGCSIGSLISSLSSTGYLHGTTSSDRGSVYMFRCLCILNSRCVCTMLCFSRFISMISLVPGTTRTSSTCRSQRLWTSPQKSPGLALIHRVRHVRFWSYSFVRRAR